MKISRLDLTSFKSFSGETFDLRSPRVFIAGLNGAGKTSLREGIRYALMGKAQALDGKGAGVDLLAPTFDVATGVKVSAWIDGIGSVTRAWLHGTTSLEVQGFEGSPTEQQAALLEKLGTSDPMLMACLDTSIFLNMHHADAKALVLALLNVTITVDEDGTPASYTLEQLDAAYDKAFEARKAAKQRVKGAFVPEKPVLPTTSVDLAAIEGRLTELRGQLAKEAAAIAGTEGQKAVLDRQLVEALKLTVVPTVPDDLDAQIEGLEERLALMEADVTAPAPEAAPVRVGSPTEDPERIRALADKLSAFDPKKGCVLDARIKCPVAKLTFTNRGKDLREDLPAAAEPPPAATPTVNPLTSLRQELERLKASKAAVLAATEANQAQTAAKERIRAEMVALPDVSAAQAKIETLQESIRKGEGIQKTAQTYLSALTAHTDAVGRRQTLEAEVARLEARVAVLGPSGARVQALGDALGRFESAVNVSLQPFGWTIHFAVDPWGVVVNGRPVETYSRSEQHRIGIALQVAIADLSGLGFAVVDELDMLDAKNRETMGAVLLRSTLEQVIILGTREAESVLPRTSAALSAYRIGQQDGRSVILERGAA
jgi:hypothetical protein